MYQDQNQILRDSFLSRKKIASQHDSNQPKPVDFAPSHGTHPKPAESFKEENQKTKKSQEENKENTLANSNSVSFSQENRIFWLNTLSIYPRDGTLPNMLTFVQVMFENLKLLEPNEPRTLQVNTQQISKKRVF